jgi:hypothetical protein
MSISLVVSVMQGVERRKRRSNSTGVTAWEEEDNRRDASIAVSRCMTQLSTIVWRV